MNARNVSKQKRDAKKPRFYVCKPNPIRRMILTSKPNASPNSRIRLMPNPSPC